MERWCASEGIPRGETLTLERQWLLAQAWYHDRLARNWRRRTPSEAQSLFRELGLESPFWDLVPQ